MSILYTSQVLGYLSELYSEIWQKTRRSSERLVCLLFIHQRSIDVQKYIIYAAVVAVDSSQIIQRICVLNFIEQRVGHTGN